MAHQQKYYKEIESNGQLWRIEIWQDTEDVLSAREIGPVLQGLNLVVQGDQADVDTAIVKTSLEMQFVDAPDLDDPRKCGYWEEFYTSSSTEYMVMLYKDGVIEWTGYITPDSFAEDLQYRGSVSIIARDNLGHLQDFTFDAPGDENGLISLSTIVSHAKQKVNFAMEIYKSIIPYQERWPVSADDANELDLYSSARFNVSAFADKNWWQALEDTMYSCGVTLRYVGSNRYVITPIRNVGLGDADFWADVPRKEAKFIAYGRRTLTPAAKTIKDEVTFEIEDNIGYYLLNADDYTDESVYDFMPMPQISNDYISMPIFAVNGGGWDGRSIENTLFLNPHFYKEKPEYRFGKGGSVHDTNNVYLACNVEYGTWKQRTASFSQLMKPGKYEVKFDIFGIIALYDENTAIGYIDSNAHLDQFNLLVKFYGNDGSVWSFKHITGGYEYEWVNEDVSDGISCSGRIPYTQSTAEFDLPVNGRLVVTISKIEVWDSEDKQSNGFYLGINNVQLIVVDNDKKPIMDKLRIVTKYNDKNNVTIVRSPKFASNPSDIAHPRVVKNGIYVIPGDDWPIGSEKWSWYVGDIQQPLSVLMHLEMLTYYSRPMDELSGELICENNNAQFKSLYIWKDKPYILTSGSLNILTGQVQNAVLREFIRYDHMWETWVENEDVAVSKEVNYITFKAHSNKALGVESWGDDVPNWVYTLADQYNEETGTHDFRVMVEENKGRDRVAIFHIDTAIVRIKQEGSNIRDYGADYGNDYL
jgi:hypothetical protein